MTKYVGGFIGGGVDMVPCGYCQLVLQWMTPTREDLKCTFSIYEGTEILEGSEPVFSVESDDYGYAEQIVPAGMYTISVDYGASGYQADGPITVNAISTEVRYVYFGAESARGSLKMTYEIPFCNISITDNDSGEVYYDGPYVKKTVGTGICTVNIVITQFDYTITQNEVGVLGEVIVDKYTSLHYIVLETSTIPGTIKEVLFSNNSVTDPEIYNNFPYLGSDTSRTIQIQIVCEECWDSNNKYPVTYTVDKSVANSDVNHSFTWSDVFCIRTSSFTYPVTASYNVAVVGGGAGGGGGGGGGGGIDSDDSYGGGGGGGGASGGRGGYGQPGKVIAKKISRTAGTTVSVTIGSAGTGGNGGLYGAGGKGGEVNGSGSSGTKGSSGGSGGVGGSTIFDGITASGGSTGGSGGGGGGAGGGGSMGSSGSKSNGGSAGVVGTNPSASVSYPTSDIFGKSVSTQFSEDMSWLRYLNRGGGAGTRGSAGEGSSGTKGAGGAGGRRGNVSNYYAFLQTIIPDSFRPRVINMPSNPPGQSIGGEPGWGGISGAGGGPRTAGSSGSGNWSGTSGSAERGAVFISVVP